MRQFVHLVVDGLVDDPGVDLGGADFSMAEHFADGFDGDPVGVSNGSGERVPGKVRGDVLFDSADRCDLLQVEIVLSIAHDREQEISISFRLVLFDDGKRNIEQLDFRGGAGFDAVGVDPFVPVIVNDQFLVSKGRSCRVIVARKAAEQEDVAHLFEPLTIRFEVDDLFEFGFSEVALVFLDLFELVSQNGSLGIWPFLKHIVVMRLKIRISFSEEFVLSLYSIFR